MNTELSDHPSGTKAGDRPGSDPARRAAAIFRSAVHIAIVATDPAGLVSDWNPGAERLFGWTADEMLGQPADRIFTPEDRQQGGPRSEMRQALADERACYERWHLRHDGSRFWAECELAPICGEDGAHLGFVRITRDRTEQHAAAEADRSDKAFLHGVLAASGDCIKVLDLDARLLSMNENGQRAMEVSDFAAIQGCEWPTFWHGAAHDAATQAVEAAIAGHSTRFQGFADTMAGNSRSWDVQVAPILGADGRPAKLLSVSRDVTAEHLADMALRASEAHWRGLFEKLQEGFVLAELVRTDGRATDWRFLDLNPAWATVIGMPAEEVLGRTVRQVFPGIEDVWTDEMAAVVESGKTVSFTRQIGPLGCWYEGHAFRLQGDRFAVLFVEVTQRKQAEDRRLALLALDDRLRDMDDPAEMAFTAASIMGETLQVSRAGYGTVDLSAETVFITRDWTRPGVPSLVGMMRFREFGSFIEDLGRGASVVIGDTALDRRTAANAVALRSVGVAALVNLPIIELGRLVALFFVNATEPRAWTSEELSFVRSIAERTRSAIERRRAEHSLRDLAASLEVQVAERTAERDRVWRNSRGLLLVVGLDGIFRAVSPAWTAILGHEPSEVVGHSFLDFIWPEDVGSAENALESAGLTNLTDFENRYRHRDGTQRWISWHTAVEGDLIYAYGRDITAQKKAQSALLRSEEALRQSQKMEAVGQLTGGIAHDFNNLLTGISGSLELLGNRIAQGRYNDVDRFIGAAQAAAKRAAALTHRLLAFSRRQALDPSPTDINALIDGMKEMIRVTVGSAVEMAVTSEDGLWPALVDSNQLENALLNLCINARDAMPEGGRITIEATNRVLDTARGQEIDLPAGQYVMICVTDTGTGMTPEVVARIFEPFFTTKPPGQGTGLGLSMIYGFARQSGGQVRVSSTPGQGTVICLYLPRTIDGDDRAIVADTHAAPPVA